MPAENKVEIIIEGTLRFSQYFGFHNSSRPTVNPGRSTLMERRNTNRPKCTIKRIRFLCTTTAEAFNDSIWQSSWDEATSSKIHDLKAILC